MTIKNSEALSEPKMSLEKKLFWATIYISDAIIAICSVWFWGMVVIAIGQTETVMALDFWGRMAYFVGSMFIIYKGAISAMRAAPLANAYIWWIETGDERK